MLQKVVIKERLAIMLDKDAVDILFFNASLLPFLKLSLPIRHDSPFAPQLHRGRLAVLELGAHLRANKPGKRVQNHIVIARAEIVNPKAMVLLLIDGWLYNAMDGRFIDTSREVLETLSSVDHLEERDSLSGRRRADGGVDVQCRYQYV